VFVFSSSTESAEFGFVTAAYLKILNVFVAVFLAP